MPGLLDLPPELIEQIHLENEASYREEREDQYDSAGIAEKLGQFRLVCRHVERSIRKSFVKTWFACWFIKGPDDASILKFCEMAKTADLAASVISMDILCEDDGSMQLQEAHSRESSTILDLSSRFARVCQTSTEVPDAQTESSRESEVTHAFDSVTGALVPVAYLRNKDALTNALRACGNIFELWFGNAPIDPKRMHLYQRDTQPSLHGHGHDDDDEGDAGEDDAGEDDAGENDAGENDAGDEDAAEDGADADADEDNEDDDYDGQSTTVHVQDSSPIVFDISSSFTYFLSLAAEAGVKPKQISTFHRCSSGPYVPVRLGLSRCAGLAESGAAFEKLEELYLDFVQDRRVPEAVPEERSLQLGRQISEGYAKMPVLTHLCLHFKLRSGPLERSCAFAWKTLADAPAIPTLKWLRFSQGICAVNVQDFARFIVKHAPSLEELRIPHMHMYNGSPKDLISLYDTLSRAPNVRVLRQNSMFVEDECVRFPQELYSPNIADEEDEDGYILVWIDARSQISCETHDEVTAVSSAMAEHLRLN